MAGGIMQSLRDKVFERDSYTCQKCRESRDLQVHHIDKNTHNNHLSNLVTLCRTCHLEEHNRKHGVGGGEQGKIKGNESRFIHFWGEGKTYDEIMSFFGISFATVSNWRRKLGLQKRLVKTMQKDGHLEKGKGMKINVEGVEAMEKIVGSGGATGTIYVPKSWIGRQVIIILRQEMLKNASTQRTAATNTAVGLGGKG